MRPGGRRAREIIDRELAGRRQRRARATGHVRVPQGAAASVHCLLARRWRRGITRERHVSCHTGPRRPRHRQRRRDDQRITTEIGRARIQIEQRVAEGEPCVVEVQGDDRAVEEARRLVHEVMGGKRLDPPYVAYAYAAMAQQGYGFPPQPNVGLASYGQVRRAHAGSFSVRLGHAAGQSHPGLRRAALPVPLLPALRLPAGAVRAAAAGSPIPGSPVARGWTQHVDANTGRPYWHHPQLGASWSPPPAGPPPSAGPRQCPVRRLHRQMATTTAPTPRRPRPRRTPGVAALGLGVGRRRRCRARRPTMV